MIWTNPGNVGFCHSAAQGRTFRESSALYLSIRSCSAKNVMANFTDIPKHPFDRLSLTKVSEVESRLEKEELHRLWCLYLGWRTAVSGNGLRKLSGAEATSIAQIETAVKELIAPHWPSAPHVSFLLALMCSSADTASRFSRAQNHEDQSYLEMAFEMFWNGLTQLMHGQESWAH